MISFAPTPYFGENVSSIDHLRQGPFSHIYIIDFENFGLKFFQPAFIHCVIFYTLKLRELLQKGLLKGVKLTLFFFFFEM